MVASCAHDRFYWFTVEADGDRRVAVPGTWECRNCGTLLGRPMGSGICLSCNRPIDDHARVGDPLMMCGVSA